MQDPLASWAAIVAAIATFAVVLLTLFNILIAKNSLKLMQQKEQRWQPNLQLYRVDAYAKRFKGQGFRVYGVNLRISNKSDADNSVKDLSLVIYFSRSATVTSNVAVPLVTSDIRTRADLIGKRQTDIITTPSLVKGHAVISGWAVFKIADDVLGHAPIEAYEVKVIDTHDLESTLEILTIAEHD